MQRVNEYPKYLYHREYNEPRMAETQDQENDLKNKGWVSRYIWKEYPKMVNGIQVKTEAEEKLLLDAAKKEPKVEVKKTVFSREADQAIAEKPKAMSVQVPEDLEKGPDQYEIVKEDGTVIPDLVFESWQDARQAQVDLNANAPGHKARKITPKE